MSIPSRDLLNKFLIWGNEKKAPFSLLYLSQVSISEGHWRNKATQKIIFLDDIKRHTHDIPINFKYDFISLAQSIAVISLSCFAIIGEIYLLCQGTITARMCAKHIALVPLHLVVSVCKAVYHLLGVTGILGKICATGTGLLTYHGLEWTVRHLSSHSLLAKDPWTRDLIYQIIGYPVVVGIGLLFPSTPIALITKVALTGLPDLLFPSVAAALPPGLSQPLLPVVTAGGAY